MKPAAYSPAAIALHWLQAGLICWLVVIGLAMVELPKGAERSAAYALHKSLGLLALALIAARLACRLRSPPPVHTGISAAERALATTMHRLLYLLLALVPLTGFAAVCFTPYPLSFFGLPLPKPGWPDADLNALFGLLHKASLATLGLAVGLHLAAVVRHALKRDGTLGRMVPRLWEEKSRGEANGAAARLL